MSEDNKFGWGIVATNFATSINNLAFALNLRKERKEKEKEKK